jgi:mannosyltransferase OCH1-like enzyme
MEKIIHQIWVGKFEMPDREKKFIEKLIAMNPSYEHKLWVNDNIPELPQNIKKLYEAFGIAKDYAHQADVLRVYLVKLYGGIYLDVDFDCIEGFENTNFHEYEGLYFNHGGNDFTIPNGAFGSSKDAPLINYLCEQIDSAKWGWYGPSWMGNMVRQYYGLPFECQHELLIPKLVNDNIKYHFFWELERDNFRHHALYSWSPENRRNFESGNINYLK